MIIKLATVRVVCAGSAKPCKYRNVSSIYVDIVGKGGLLMDCGEGSLAQLHVR